MPFGRQGSREVFVKGIIFFLTQHKVPLSVPIAFIYSRSRSQGDFYLPNIAKGLVLLYVLLFFLIKFTPSIMFLRGRKKPSTARGVGAVKVSSFYHFRPPRFHHLNQTILLLHVDSVRQDQFYGLSLR